MKTFRAILSAILLLVVLATGVSAAEKVTVERVTYRGWIDSYRITAGPYSVVVVPQIGGRIMEYSIRGRNVIWENPEEFGKTYSIGRKDWHNFGGYKTWLAPQDSWVWPPDPNLDYATVSVEILQTKDGIPILKLTGSPSLSKGVLFTKEISLDGNGEVTLKQRMHNIGGKPINYSVWDNTQVKTPCFVVFPVRAKSRFEGKLHYIWQDSNTSRQFMIKKGLCVATYLGDIGKIGTDSDGPWMVWFNDNLAYAKLFSPMEKGKEYPDEGCSAELFTSEAKLGYVEMEVLSPMSKLSPGEGTELTERWRIFELSQPVTDENRALKAVDGMEGKKWIPSR